MAYKYDPNARYAKTHDWVRVDAERGLAVCGISDYAQNALSDVVYIELPEVGAHYKQGQQCATVDPSVRIKQALAAQGITKENFHETMSGSAMRSPWDEDSPTSP